MRERISLESAIEKCCEQQRPCRNIETIPVEHGYKRVIAKDLKAFCDVPPFNSSRMDGYALCRSDLDILKNLSDSDSLSLQVVAHISAGNSAKLRLLPGQTVRIMTGAIVPEETAAIIKQEDITRTGEERICIGRGKYHHSNILFKGSLIKAGQELVSAGELLNYNQVERIASTGIPELPVYIQPAVYIINTGSELTLPGKPLAEGKIYNSNRSLLTAKLQKEHCKILIGQCPIEDNLEDIYREINRGLETADMVIISGGAADGDYDLVPSALKKIKADFIYNGLRMQPGAKSSAAVKDGKLVFSLPGNPGANGILFEALIMPILNKLKGMKNITNNWFEVVLAGNTIKSTNLRRMCRGELLERCGSLVARPIINNEPIKGITSVILDVEPGQGNEDDIVRAMLVR
ncbi:MAG: molybdopterin molybdotransferase MoeA [Syntrophomonas sp.]